MQHWNLLISWNSETVQIFSKHIHILQGLLKLIHNSNQSHLMPILSKKGYTNLFFYPLKSMSEKVKQSSIDPCRKAVVMFLVKKSLCEPGKYFFVVHTLVSSWLWNHNNGKPVIQKTNIGDQNFLNVFFK